MNQLNLATVNIYQNKNKNFVFIFVFVLHSFLNADFACAAVFISFGAVVDVTTPLQLIVMAICEIALYATNEFISLEIFQVFAGTHCIGRCPHLSTMLFFRLSTIESSTY